MSKFSCPACKKLAECRCLESRTPLTGETTRRRRMCLNCNHRFTTYEEVEFEPAKERKATAPGKGQQRAAKKRLPTHQEWVNFLQKNPEVRQQFISMRSTHGAEVARNYVYNAMGCNLPPLRKRDSEPLEGGAA